MGSAALTPSGKLQGRLHAKIRSSHGRHGDRPQRVRPAKFSPGAIEHLDRHVAWCLNREAVGNYRKLNRPEP
jgi:hypothetical protein